MAVRLEKAFGSTAAAWVRLQANYDLSWINPDEVQVHPAFLVAV